MTKSSRADAERHRREIIAVASRLLRERGDAAISVQQVMGEVGLTHGGFYKHFSSKEELMRLAAEEAFSGLIDDMSAVRERPASKPVAWNEFIEGYFSDRHRQDRAGGCANTALASDSARASEVSGIREAYVHGVSETLEALKLYQEQPELERAHHARVQALITMVGALTLSRATDGTELSDEFVVAAKNMLENATIRTSGSNL